MYQINKRELKQKYLIENLTILQCSKIFNVSNNTIIRRIKKYGLKKTLPQGQFPELRNKKWLIQKYVYEKKSSIEIARLLGCSSRIVFDWMKNHKIKSRTQGESRKGVPLDEETKRKLSESKKGRFAGNKNPNWKGGQISKYQRIRQNQQSKLWSVAVRNRDRFKCQFPNCSETNHLHAHHIESYLKFPKLRYELSNGITLCSKHHETIHLRKFPNWIHNKSKKFKKRIITAKSVVIFKPAIKKFKRLYLQDKFSCYKMSKIYDVNPETVRKKLVELKVKRRPAGGQPRIIINKNKLKELYIKKSLSMKKIAKLYNCGETVIHKLIHRNKLNKLSRR